MRCCSSAGPSRSKRRARRSGRRVPGGRRHLLRPGVRPNRRLAAPSPSEDQRHHQRPARDPEADPADARHRHGDQPEQDAEHHADPDREAEGLGLCLLGAATVLASVTTVVVLGRWLVGAPFDDLFGIISGTTGNPAILAHASRLTPIERPDVDYAMIHPAMTLLKIIAAQIVVATFPP